MTKTDIKDIITVYYILAENALPPKLRWKENAPLKWVNLLLYGMSFACFLLLLTVGDSLLTALGCIPFFILLCAGFHELGHCAGCLMTGSPIREVRLPLFVWDKRRFYINNRLNCVSCCAFRKNKAPWLVYLMGPLFSLALFFFFHWAYLAFPSASTATGSILAFVILAVNAIPFRRNDAAMVLREIFFRNETNS